MKKLFNVLKEVHCKLYGNAHKYRHHYAYVNGLGGVASFLEWWKSDSFFTYTYI